MEIIGFLFSEDDKFSFIDLIFINKEIDASYYIQVFHNGKLEFKKVEINLEEIIELKNININISNELIYLFVKDKDNFLLGTINEIKNGLLKYLNDKTIPIIARIEIANELKLWGLTKKLLNEAEMEFNSDGFQQFEFDNLIDKNDNFVIDIDYMNQNIPKILKTYGSIISNEGKISWHDAFVFNDNNSITIGNIDTSPDVLFDKVLELGVTDLAKKMTEACSPIRSYYLERKEVFNDPNEYLMSDNMKDNKRNILKIASVIKAKHYV